MRGLQSAGYGQLTLLLNNTGNASPSGYYVGGRLEWPLVSTVTQGVLNVYTGNTSWTTDVNAAIAMAGTPVYTLWRIKLGAVDPTSATQQGRRIYVLASILLDYNPTFTIIQPETADLPSSICNGAGPLCDHLWPEYGLVPYNPPTPAPVCNLTGVTCPANPVLSFQDAGGAYEREYNDAFYNGTRVGRVAVVVNPQATAVPWPTSLSEDYTTAAVGRTPQQIVLHNGGNCVASCTGGGPNFIENPGQGAEIDNGGFADFTGGPAPTTIPATSAVIVVDTAK
jgi:hypothetical protein